MMSMFLQHSTTSEVTFLRAFLFAHPEPGNGLAVDGQDDVAGLDHGKRRGAGHAAPNFHNLCVSVSFVCVCVGHAPVCEGFVFRLCVWVCVGHARLNTHHRHCEGAYIEETLS